MKSKKIDPQRQIVFTSTKANSSIRHRLFFFVFILILCFLVIAIPLILSSYKQYQQSNDALIEIKLLKALSEGANHISKERAFANKLMSSPPEQIDQRRAQLLDYRTQVNQSLNTTIQLLRSNDNKEIADYLITKAQPNLNLARLSVDRYAQTQPEQKSFQQYDRAVKQMFNAWDYYREALKMKIINSNQQDDELFRNMILILLVSDLRDQSGRVASNIIASISYQQQIPEENRARSLQTQYQALYLWKMIDTLQTQYPRTAEYNYLYHQVKIQFLDQGIGLVSDLIQESDRKQPYSLTATQLTEHLVEKFSAIIELQSYLVKETLDEATRQQAEAKQKFITTVILSLLSLLVSVLTLHYIERYILSPLIQAREEVLHLFDPQTPLRQKSKSKRVHGEFVELFDAIARLRDVLVEKDKLELKLRKIAHTDTLSGVANRKALTAYLGARTAPWSDLCLIIMDIDFFKQINDQHGHIAGDHVIQAVARQLMAHESEFDLVVRYGGDEFLLLIEQITQQDALDLAESIRRQIEAISVEQQIDVSVSIGVAVGAENWLALFKKADSALLQSKAKGKNRVEAALS